MSTIEKVIPEKEIDIYTAICYTDGSSGPSNPGFYGSGVHGYIFRDQDIDIKSNDKPGLGNIMTTIGYTNQPLDNNKSVKIVKPTEYFNAMFSFGYDAGTNNVAEIMATTKIIKYLLEHHHTYKQIIVKTDSTYVIGIYEKLMTKDKTGYDHTTISELKNAEHYDVIDNLLKEMDTLGISLLIKKVKGHSDNLGNNLADGLAGTARVNGEQGIEGDFVKFYPGNKYWKPTINKHSFLRVNQLFYTQQDRKTIGTNKYVIMDYDTDIEVGKMTNGAMFGVIELNDENAKGIEEIIDIDTTNKHGLSILSAIDLTAYYSQFHLVSKELGGTSVYTNRKNHIEIMFTMPIITPVSPQGLAKASLTTSLTLYNTMDNYKAYRKGDLTNTDDLYYVDITDTLYDTTGKKYILKIDNNVKILKIPVMVKGKEIILTIPLKREIVDRNTLKQMEKDKPKVFIEITIVNNKTLTYNTIIDIGDEIGVYTNFYTTSTIL